jgi:hypothetical protein
MWETLRDFWLPRFLFMATLGLAGALAAVVIFAPCIASDHPPEILTLFAKDAIVRRTALASAVGLVVTAFVFFRPGGFLLFRQKDKNRVPPPMAGA